MTEQYHFSKQKDMPWKYEFSIYNSHRKLHYWRVYLKEFDQVEKEYFDRDTHFYKALTDNYELENHDDIPMGLKNRIYVIKDR